MELTETIDSLNRQLADLYGIDTESTKQMWRVAWGKDQFEKVYGRFQDFTPNGLFIREVTEVRIVPKYRGYASQERYFLERLVAVPPQDSENLLGAKISYEPIWCFEDKNGNYLPPKMEACQFIINTILAVQHGTGNLARYVDNENTPEARSKKVDQIQEELFGDQSSLQGTSVSGETIFVPSNYEKVN